MNNEIVQENRARFSIGEIVRRYNVWVLFIAVVILSTITSQGAFFQGDNLINVAERASIVGIVAIGQTLVILTGGIDLSVSAVMTITYVMQSMFAAMGFDQGTSALLAICIAIFVGLLNGLMIAKTKVAPFMVTLSTMMIVESLVLIITKARALRYQEFQDFINKGLNISVLGARLLPSVLMITFMLIIIVIMAKTKMGTSITALGGNMRAAFLSGVKVNKYTVLVYTLSGLFAGLASMTLAYRIPGLNPGSAAPFQMESIAAVVIGGTSITGGEGSVVKTLFGAIIIATLVNLMNILLVDAFLQYSIKGLILIVIVVNANLLSRKQR